MNRSDVLTAILAAGRADARVVGIVDYGSGAGGRADDWSDLDLVFFVRDAEQPVFEKNWKDWVAEVAKAAGVDLLMLYRAGDHPRAVFETEPAPLRADLAFFPEAKVAELPTWNNVWPVSAEAMVLYDRNGSILQLAGSLVGGGLGAVDYKREFEHANGDLWNYLLRVYALMKRGETLAARTEYGWYVLDNLAALMRLEVKEMGRWRMSLAANRLGKAVRRERLEQLHACVPGTGEWDLREACARSAELGVELCEALARQEGWAWPVRMGRRCVELFAAK